MDLFQGQHQPLTLPLYTRQQDLQMIAMEQISFQNPVNLTFLTGIPPLVSPPPPDTPPPQRFVSFNHSINLNQPIKVSGKLKYKIRDKFPRETTISGRKKTSPSTFWFQNWISSIKTQKSNPPSETKLIKLPRENCREEDSDESTIDNSVSKLKSVRHGSDPVILNDWKPAISTQNYNLPLPDDKGNSCLSFSTSTRSNTWSSQDSTRSKINGTRVIMPTKSKGGRVKVKDRKKLLVRQKLVPVRIK